MKSMRSSSLPATKARDESKRRMKRKKRMKTMKRMKRRKRMPSQSRRTAVKTTKIKNRRSHRSKREIWREK